jgi:23S rRNA (cytosine1962-C5)-methyltransferase
MLSQLILKPGREKSLRRRHPWIFSGAVAEVLGAPEAGDTVDVFSSNKEFLARAAYSPRSQIISRVWTWNPDEQIGVEFFRRRLLNALAVRQDLSLDTNAIRLVHGESDGLPGLVVDLYGGTVVLQMLAAGIDHWRDVLVELIQQLTGASTIYERSDVDACRLEGLPMRTGCLYGNESPERLLVNEQGINFLVDVCHGHKTGFYLDQRANRVYVRQLAKDCEVLDCFSYTGGFTLNALAGGALSVVAIDSSKESLSLGRENLLLNRMPVEKVDLIEGDVFKVLREFRDRGRKFDLIVLDPPKFAPTVAQLERATRGYKDINLLALKLLRPGGYLATFSCSGGVSEDLFQKIVAGAALDAGVDALIVDRLFQGSDHPVALNFPEGAYLKGLVLRTA